jgi:hypothetical protein
LGDGLFAAVRRRDHSGDDVDHDRSSAPFAFSWSRLPRFNWQLRVASGLISFGFGLLLIYQIGFTDGGLFTATPSWQPH